MPRKRVIRKRKKRQEESESSELFQNNHSFTPHLTPNGEGPFVHIIGDIRKRRKRKKRKRKWVFLDED